MGLFNWLFGKVAEKVSDREYGKGQTAFAPDLPPAVQGHASDCAVHNGPAYPPEPCDCGVGGH